MRGRACSRVTGGRRAVETLDRTVVDARQIAAQLRSRRNLSPRLHAKHNTKLAA